MARQIEKDPEESQQAGVGAGACASEKDWADWAQRGDTNGTMVAVFK